MKLKHYSLKTLLGLVLICSIVFAWFANVGLSQRAARRAIEKVGGLVIYSYQTAPYSYRDELGPLRPLKTTKPLLCRLVGDDFGDRIVSLELSFQGEQPSDDVMRHIADLPRVEVLDLAGASLRDDQLQYLAGLSHLKKLGLNLDLNADPIDGTCLHYLGDLPELETLNLIGCKITDDSWVMLRSGFPRLKYLLLDSTHLTDKCVDSLGGLTGLEYLLVRDVSNDFQPAISRLRQALPHVQIVDPIELF